MTKPRSWLLMGLVVSTLIGALYGQRQFRQYPAVEYYFPLPQDWRTSGEWVFGRLMYPPINDGRRGWRRRSNVDWREGLSNWTIDYPRSDRHISAAVRRLTRIQARSSSPSTSMTPTMFTTGPGYTESR